MITNNDIEIINANVNQKYFSVDKLLEYLNTHVIVEREVFKIIMKNPLNKPTYLSVDLDDKYGYAPIPVESFIRRIPFYFYYPEDKVTHFMHASLASIMRSVTKRLTKSEEEIASDIEKIYKALEEIHYHYNIRVDDIFGYMDMRGNKLKTEQFMEWYDYLKLCEKLHWYDFMPDDFIYKYNLALEATGRKPIIYDLDEVLPGEYIFRNGNTMEIEGTFPVYPTGKPVLRWIGIILKNPGRIICSVGENHFTASKIIIELKPTTELYARNLYNSDEEGERWYRLYAGPQIMEFDFTVLKNRRQRLKMTQKEVAEAVGATLRTYQKWENGETTPDSKFLLRLLNWLDIRDVVDATKWSEDWDSV